jgi:peptidoglycan/xylan/chitin deacetylase (PgdA/CDA1 family)
MTKTKKIIIAICLIIIIFITVLFVIYKKNMQKIDNFIQPFSEEKMIDSNNALATFLNNNLKIHEDIVNLSTDDLVNLNTIKDLKKLTKTIDDEITKVSSIKFNDDLESNITSYSYLTKREIRKKYLSSSFIKDKENDEEKINKYLEKLNNEKLGVKYLSDNKNKYTLKSDKIIYKDDNFKNDLSIYNFDLNLVKLNTKGIKVPILMYHGILDKAWGDQELFVKIDDFKAQMKYLKDNKYTPIFLSEINEAYNYDKPVIITFDDGYEDVFTNGYPVLKSYNFKANAFIITSYIGNKVYITADQIKEMSSSGVFEIGSHTVTHPYLPKLSNEKLDEEFKNSQSTLQSLLNKKVTTLAYPMGGNNESTHNIARKYYDYAVTTKSGYNYTGKLDNIALNRLAIYRTTSYDSFINYIN